MAVVAASDVVAHRLRRPAARVMARFAAAGAVLAIARAAGVTWAELGLGRRGLAGGARLGAAAGGCAAAAALTAAAVPATRVFLRDERAAAAAAHRRLAAEMASITFARVPPEELTYRAGLVGLRLASGSRASAIVWPGVLFGLSHILPTVATMGHSPLRRHLAGRPLRWGAFVAANVAVTSAAGAGFGWLRLRSGSVLAPLLAHAALNDSALLAGRVAHMLADGRDTA